MKVRRRLGGGTSKRERYDRGKNNTTCTTKLPSRKCEISNKLPATIHCSMSRTQDPDLTYWWDKVERLAALCSRLQRPRQSTSETEIIDILDGLAVALRDGTCLSCCLMQTKQ